MTNDGLRAPSRVQAWRNCEIHHVAADRVAPDAVNDMLITLLPGESTTFQIDTSALLTLDQLVEPLILRSANQLSAGT